MADSKIDTPNVINEMPAGIIGDVYAIPDFVRASDRNSDPVGQYKGEWGFWDETWSDWNGGFTDEADARNGVRKYIREVLGGE